MRISDWSSDVCSSDLGKKVEPAQPPASESAGMESDHDALRGQRPALPRSGIDGAASRAFEHQGFSGRSDAGCGRSADADDNTFVSRIDDTNIAQDRKSTRLNSSH